MSRRELRSELSSATSEDEVVDIVVRFLAQWCPGELAHIPPPCRPRSVGDAEEIADLAFGLTRARIESVGPQPLLEEMEAFFACACARISALETPRLLTGKPYLTR
jgi:hypothetical protein